MLLKHFEVYFRARPAGNFSARPACLPACLPACRELTHPTCARELVREVSESVFLSVFLGSFVCLSIQCMTPCVVCACVLASSRLGLCVWLVLGDRKQGVSEV